jgi:FlaA1/EpsC-like NDP-sugar epimerase
MGSRDGRPGDHPRVKRGHEFWTRRRTVLQPSADASIWIFSLVSASLLRYGRTVPPHFWRDAAMIVGIAIGAQLAIGFATSLYRVRWQVGSFEEMVALVRVMVPVTVLLVVVIVSLPDHPLPVSSVVGGGALSLILAGGARSLWRASQERSRRPTDRAERAIVFGAGRGGIQLLNALLSDPDSPYVPVALLDDDPAKRHARVRHLRVSGTREDLRTEAARLHADTVIIAIPSAESELIRELSDLAAQVDLTLKVLPTVSRFLDLNIGVSDVRPVTEADLLGRHMVDTEIDSIAGYLTGRRVLVTGAGGSIGSELCRQIHRFAPARLIMLDHAETGLHQVQLSIEGRALLDDRSVVVCDIRDELALNATFAEHQPEVVFHAAALKHLPLLEMWPAEAVKTNVVGTQQVLEAAAAVGVERFVNISTDKAAKPSSVLGYTKRLAERLTAGMGERSPGTYLSVRFGNVLGSSGSVLRSFRAQIDAGGPVTVTDPQVTRYFMMVEEAVQLVIQAGAIGRDGEVLVLDMGKPVRIAEVAERLIRDSRRPIQIAYTGLRAGEKLHEDLFGEGERDERPVHALISHVPVPPLDALIVSEPPGLSATFLKRSLQEACEDSRPQSLLMASLTNAGEILSQASPLPRSRPLKTGARRS